MLQGECLDGLVVRKANDLISMQIKGYSLTHLKLFNYTVSLIDKMDDDASIVVPARVLLSALYDDGKGNYSKLKKATLGMIKGVELPMENGVVAQIPIYHSFVYIPGGMVKIQFHESVVPFILQRNKYSQYYYQNIRGLGSKYSLRVYELCKQYEPTSHKYRSMSLDEFRSYLDIEPNKYVAYSNLKARVILPCVTEVNESTDINLTFDELRQHGQKVTGIRFNIESKKSVLITDCPATGVVNNDDDTELFNVTRSIQRDYFFSREQALEIQRLAVTEDVLEYCKGVLEEKINTRRSSEKIKNITSYARSVLLTDIQTALDTDVVHRIAEQEKKDLAEREDAIRLAALKQEKVEAERKIKAENEARNAKFKSFCERSDLMDVLGDCDLSTLTEKAKVVVSPDVLDLAVKELKIKFGVNNLDDVNALLIFGVLSGQLVLGRIKHAHIMNIKNFYKIALESLYS